MAFPDLQRCDLTSLARSASEGWPSLALRASGERVAGERKPNSLSIIIPSHNRADLLRACLASVDRFAPAGVEAIVVDDASRDSAVSAVAAEFAGVRCLRLPRRRGFAAAANAGIRAARHEIVELLNDDTEVTADWATAALAAFADPAVGAVAPLVLMHPAAIAPDQSNVRRGCHAFAALSTLTSKVATDGPRKHATQRLPADITAVWTNNNEEPIIDSAGDRYYLGGVAGKHAHGERLGPVHRVPCRVFGASASSAFYRRDVLLRVGAFPESFGAYFEDVDLAFRLHWAGYDIAFEPRSVVYHRVSASYGRPCRRLLEQQSCNEERVFWRNIPRYALPRALPRHFAVLAAKAWRRWQEGNLVPFVVGRLRVVGEVADVLRHRRQLHELRPATATDWQLDARFGA